MKIISFFSNLFRFRKTSVSLFIVLTFLITIYLQHVTNYISLQPPKEEPSILTDAWKHLQIISSTEHPFTSHSNDFLHDYLDNVINDLTDKVPYITVASDKSDNHTIFINQHNVFNKTNTENRIIYYESSNLLVKIQGSDASLPGILLSAHFDSVPTAYGTTDDGMGIASMLAVLKYFSESKEQPLRTLVFNFNNNEEFGLLGAESFVRHEWFKDVAFFINLEGTGAGGHPILFRGTDKSVLDWYKSVSKPFANSIFQEGFNSGFIASQTDYYVYEKHGLRGIDIAFYLPRSLYHTVKDNIKYTTKGSLWMMINNVLEILIDVTSSKETYDQDLRDSIYFDILKMWYFNISLDNLFFLNVFLLVTVPLIIMILLSILMKKKTWVVGSKGWLRFPVVLLVSYYVTTLSLRYFYVLNPLLISVDYFLPLVFVFCLTTLIGYSILSFANIVRKVHDQKLFIFLQLNALSWISLVWITYEINNNFNTAGYCITIFYILTSLATIVGLIGMLLRSSPCYDNKITCTTYGSNGQVSDEQIYSDNISNADQTINTNDEENSPLIHNINDLAAAQTTNEAQPLLTENTVVIDYQSRESYMHDFKHRAINSFQYDWFFQFIILVPLTVFFVYTEGTLVLDALHQTVQESKLYDEAVWEFVGLMGALLAISLTPFLDKLNVFMILFLIALSVHNGILTFFTPSYTESSPMKLRFAETFNVNTNSSSGNVFGRQGYIPEILSEVSYLDSTDIKCTPNEFSGTETCSYTGKRPWLLSGTSKDNSFNNYMNVTVLSNTNDGSTDNFDVDIEAIDKFTPLETILEIQVRDSRLCYMTFNTSNSKIKSPVKMATLYKDGNNYFKKQKEKEITIPNGMSRDKDGNWIFKVMQGIDLLSLHKLSWESNASGINKFVVKLEWLPFIYDNDVELINNLGVNIQCDWSNYDEVVVIDGIPHEKVENYVDLMTFTNVGVAWTNLRAGIVEGIGYVEI
jgi:hypothetical protein